MWRHAVLRPLGDGAHPLEIGVSTPTAPLVGAGGKQGLFFCLSAQLSTPQHPWWEARTFFFLCLSAQLSTPSQNIVPRALAVLQHGCFDSKGNQYSFMHASSYIIVRNGFSMNFSICGSSAWWSRARMVHVTALDIQISLRNLTAILEDSMMSVKTPYIESLLNKHWNMQASKYGLHAYLACSFRNSL